MEGIKKEVDLKLDRQAPPWQVVGGEGQTWVILRCKMSVPNADITELGQLVLLNNTCERIEGGQSQSLYRGKICLQAFYKSRSHNAETVPYPPAVYDEQQAREQLAYTRQCSLPQEASGVEAEPNSIFLSQLYEELTLTPPSNTLDLSVWQVEMPWQGWLEGEEMQGQPEIVLAHLGQIGLGTLLCEVLLSLTTPARQETNIPIPGSNYFLAGEEVILNLPQGEMTKLVGSAIRRAFYQIRPGKSRGLQFDYFTKVDLIYLGTDSGGERILTASGLVQEHLQLPVRSLPALPPFLIAVKQEKVTLVKTGEQKIALKVKVSINIGEDGQVLSAKQQNVDAGKVEQPPEVRSSANDECRPTVVRLRPGEKWLKKKVKESAASSSHYKVLTIKLST